MNTKYHSQPGARATASSAAHPPITAGKISLRAGCLALALGLVALLGLPSPVAAQILFHTHWNGGDGSWFDIGNWDPTFVPMAGQNIYISNGGTARISNATANGPAHVGNIVIGREQFTSGSIVIENGGVLTSGETSVGRRTSSEGTALLTGTNSVWNLAIFAPFIVGQDGTGTFTISNAAAFYATNCLFDVGVFNRGHLTISGQGSRLVLERTEGNNSELRIGLERLLPSHTSEGLVRVEKGGMLSTYALITMGSFGANGRMILTDTGSVWNAYDSALMRHGTMDITNGAAYINMSGGVQYVGFGSNAQVIVTSPGSRFHQAGDLVLGRGFESHGTFTVEDGAWASSGYVELGGASSGEGKLHINGTFGRRGVFQVGRIDRGLTGTMHLDGGILRAARNESAWLRYFPAVEAVLEAGGGFIDTAGFSVGIPSPFAGQGLLTKLGAGDATLTAMNTYTGGTTVKQGALAVSTGSIAHPAANMVVGEGIGDNGTLWITNGAAVTNANGYIGQAGAVGTVVVRGANSKWVNGGLSVGTLGNGTLILADGGVVRVGNGTSALILGEDFVISPSQGTLRIGDGGQPGVVVASAIQAGDGTATVVFNHTSPNYALTQNGLPGGTAVPMNGNLQVVHDAGFTALEGTHGYTGLTVVNGGTLAVHGSLTGGGPVTIASNGRVSGIGSIAGSVTNSGVVAPGSSVGALGTGPQTWQGGSVYECDFAGSSGTPGSSWDKLNIGGDLVINATASTPVRIALRSLSGGIPGRAPGFDGVRSGQWTIAAYTGSLIGFAPEKFVVDTSEFLNAQPGDVFSITASGGELRLQLTRPALVDLTAPGQPIVPTTFNSPVGESMVKAIDNTAATKYLNFDEFNSGFTITLPEASTARSLTLISANDAPERDPASYRIEGSTDGVNFTVIASNAVTPFAARHALQSFNFENETAFSAYRVTFPTVANPAAADSMQIAEVELLPYGEITSTNDAVSVTLPTGASNVRGLARLFDRELGDTNKFEIAPIAGGDTVVDIVPSAGPTVLKGFELIGSADDVTYPERRPASITVAGSDDGTNFTTLSVVTVAAPSANLQIQEFLTSANTNAFARYRIAFGPPVGGTRLQVGELRLFGETIVTTPPALTIRPSGNNVLVSWPNVAGFNLETKTALNDASWTLVGIAPVLSNGVNTATVPMSATTGFFRLQK